MSRLVEWLDGKLYPGVGRNWDDEIFRERILRTLTPGAMLLDVGAGAGVVKQMDFRGRAARVCGVDLDPRVTENPFLDEGRLADAGRIPYDDATFDVAFADNVMEHLDEPALVFAEIARVLKPGGTLLFKTPNRTHYMPAIARATPHRFHQLVNRRRGRKEMDTFPTRYRANSPRQVAALAAATGFAIESIDRIEGRPEYMRISGPTYMLGAAYERAVNATDLLARFRILLIAQLRRTGTPIQSRDDHKA
ncbi:MAG: class I SAM-dependent methyltransferase [Beijerinckiaceae bacterium]|nr:class I SAM-dependent methyltransferase [Beijerinckiaceae bacterium]